jgi:hypothetical protein
MMDAAYKRKLEQEFSGISATSFWEEFLKAIQVLRKYHSQTLEGSEKEWAISRAQGSVSAIDKILRLPSDLTGVGKPLEDKETN